jgi:hypothetical protein
MNIEAFKSWAEFPAQMRPTMRAPDLGYAPRFLSIFVALGFSRFEGESALPPQAGNAHRWAVRYFLLIWSKQIWSLPTLPHGRPSKSARVILTVNLTISVYCFLEYELLLPFWK